MLRALFYRRPQPSNRFRSRLTARSIASASSVTGRRGATRSRIQAATREVLLTMPPRGSLKEAKAFAQKHGGWIAARLHRLPLAAPFSDGDSRAAARRAASHLPSAQSARHGLGRSRRPASNLLCVAGDAPHLHRRVSDYLRREARRDLLEASRRYAATLDVNVASVTVRDQVSRWGSCSTDGRSVVLVASHPRAALRARLSRRPRSRHISSK